jgi:septal ring factor EnvC (AmiA/AmiB activator)
MKIQLSALLAMCALSASAHAQSEVFVCINEQGLKEYKNTGTTKGCKRVELQGVSMIPAPYRKTVAHTASARPSVATPPEFPRIDSSAQKARDNDRLQILTEEMKVEEKKLSDLKKEFNNGEPERQGNERNYAKYQERVASMQEDVNRTEKNIEALKREIGNLK